jgi:hypothetical protein
MHRRQLIQAAALAALLGARAGRAQGTGDTPYDWKTVPFGAGGFIDGFVFHPREPGLLYARTDIGGCYRFEPGTRSWTPLLDQLGKEDSDLMGVLALAVDPANPARVYAACGIYTGTWARTAAVLSSTDRGASWQVHDLKLRLGGNEGGRGTGERLAVDPHQGEVLLLGTTQDGLLRSSDRGQSFNALAFAPRHVSLVLFDPGSGKPGQACRTIYAGSHDQPGLYVSHDAGQSFAREPGVPAQVPQRAVFGPDGTLYVAFALGNPAFATNPGNATTGSVWKRAPNGRWTEITPVKPGSGTLGFGYSGIDVDRQRPGRLIVSTIERWTEGDEIFVSSDDGAHWTPLGAHSRHDARPYPWLANYMRGIDRMGHWLADVKIDPFNGERAVYGTGYGLWLTGNLGAAEQGGTVDWDFTVANFEETATLEVRSPSGGASLLAAMGDVGGGAWDALNRTPQAALFAPTSETNRSVDFAEANPAILARTADNAAGGYWSPNGGVSWRPFGPSARIAAKPGGGQADSGRVAVSAKGGFFLWAPDKQNAFCSRDHGKSWQAVEGWPATREESLVPVADRTVEGVFYVHVRGQGQILVSVDGGQSFQPAITGLPVPQSWQASQLICAPGTMRDLWLALGDVLLHFPGADRPTEKMATVAEPWMIALGKAAPGAAYPSLYVWGKLKDGETPQEGLFRSDNAGATFTRINDDLHRYGRLLSMTADPLEYGTVYISAHGRGVLMGKPRT